MKKFETGLTLVELMIALVLGSLLMLGVTQVYINNSRTSMIQKDFSRVQEAVRVSMEIIAKDVRMADYRGCKGIEIVDHLDHSDADYDSDAMDVSKGGVEGLDDVTSQKVGGLDVIDGTDILTLRGANDACGGVGRMVPAETSASIFVSSDCSLKTGDIVMVTNCEGGDLFSVTSASPGAGGSGKRTVTHNTGNIAETGAVDNSFQTIERDYGANSLILTPYTRKYFIAEGTNGVSLYVKHNKTAMELVPGITDFQVTYGEDTNDDGAVNVYRKAGEVTDMEKVRSIKVKIKAEDGSVSREFSATSHIRNR